MQRGPRGGCGAAGDAHGAAAEMSFAGMQSPGTSGEGKEELNQVCTGNKSLLV